MKTISKCILFIIVFLSIYILFFNNRLSIINNKILENSLEAMLQLGMIIPLCIFFLDKKAKDNYLQILFFVLIYIGSESILLLPNYIKQLNFIQSNWNWEGKILGITYGIICYYVFRKRFTPNNLFTLKQKRENIRITSIVSISVVVIMSLIYYFIAESDFDIETLAFQLTMPALDEEIISRGVLLGLLLTILKDKVSYLGNPSIFITGILFGLSHALTLNNNFEINFDSIYFIHTGLGGYIFGWLALKSRSILLPILTHGFTNFFAAFATMI